MTLGAEPKKLGVLALLLVVAGYVIYSNLAGDEGPPPAAARAPARTSVQAAVTRDLDAPPAVESRPAAAARSRSLEFRPSLRRDRSETGPDPFATDPTLRLDLLAKVQAVKLQGGERNLFQLLSFVLARAGPELSALSSSPTITDLFPSFTIHPGESGATAVRRLLAMAPDVLFFRGEETATEREQQRADIEAFIEMIAG